MPVFRRFFRVTFKLTLIAAVGFGIAMVVKKLTAPADSGVPIEPWPPLPTEGSAVASAASAKPSTSTNGDTAADAADAPTS